MKARAVRRLVVGLALSLVPLPRVFGAENPGAKRSEYDVRLENPALREGAHAVYRAENPAHNLSLAFEGADVRAVPRAAEAPVFWLDLSVTGIGAGETTSPFAKPARASVSGNRIGYDFGDVRQWYVNGASGLEQGVVLLEPPPGGDPDPGRPIHVDLSIGGSLSPRLIENGTAVGLFTQQGKWILECGDLAASDASGKELPARIELRPDSTRSLLRISIDASDATYPLLVRARFRRPARPLGPAPARSRGRRKPVLPGSPRPWSGS